jgi:CNT family concentrative nucleoside transporter
MLQLQSAFGVVALLALAWILSENRRAVSLRQTAIGLAVTFATAVVLIKLPGVAHVFGAINDAVGAIASSSRAGTSFVFGYLGGGALPFDLKSPGADFILAFQALPIVLVMSVLTTLLFYWRILPPVVRGLAWVLERTLGIGGAVGLSTAANIFLGMVEAPLFIRPYLAQLTRSELFLVMTGGMAGIAGTVLVLYATLLAPLISDAGRARGDPHQPDHGAGDHRREKRRHLGRSAPRRRSGPACGLHHGCDRQGHHRRP